MKKKVEERPTNGDETMKIQVLHDEKGEILSFSLVKNGVEDGLSLAPKKNQSIKVVDLPMAIEENVNDEEAFGRLIDRIKQHKIDTKSKNGKLVRKKG